MEKNDRRAASRIKVIQAIRAISALLILTYHSMIIGEIGYSGVEFFCLISGYVMMLSTVTPPKQFLVRRLVRIAPLYWLCTVVMYLLILWRPGLSIMSIAKPGYLLKSILFIPFDNGTGYTTPIISVGWTLNYEVFFIAVFFIAMCISHKYRGMISVIVMLFLAMTGMLFKPDNIFLKYYTDSYILEFAYGIVLYYLIEIVLDGRGIERFAVSEKDRLLVLRMIIAAISLVLAFWILLDPMRDMIQYRGFRLGLPAFALMFLILFMFRNTHMPGGIVRLGNISYSFYLIEFFTTAAYKSVVSGKTLFIKIILFAVLVAVTAVLSYISWIWIEKKCVIRTAAD